MRSRHSWLAPFALFCLQSTPYVVSTDSAGKVRITFGGGLGSYVERPVGCNGEVLGSRDIPFQQVGGQADVWISPALRVTGYGGALFAAGDQHDAGGVFSTPYEGGYGGALMAWESRAVGIGGGVSIFPVMDRYSPGPTVRPAVYLRLGRMEAAHFRMDWLGPSGSGAPPRLVRIGVGFGQGHERTIGGFLGLGLFPFPRNEGSFGVVGDLMVPVSQSLDLGGTGALHSGLEGGGGVGFDLGVMIRLHLGGPPR